MINAKRARAAVPGSFVSGRNVGEVSCPDLYFCYRKEVMSEVSDTSKVMKNLHFFGILR